MAEQNITGVNLSAEVLKSRRNLVVLSFVTIFILIISPNISELKFAGIEIKFIGNINCITLLLCATVFESITFIIRFHVSHFGEQLGQLISKRCEIEEKLDNILTIHCTARTNKEIDHEIIDIINNENKTIETIKQDQKTMKNQIMNRHKIVECYMPLMLAGVAIGLCAHKILTLWK